MLHRIAAATVVALSLAACVGPRYVATDVTRFHTLPTSPSGQTFAVVAVDKEQEQSLAFRQFSDVVAGKLSAVGLRAFSGDRGKPDYVVTLRYAVDGPSPDIRSRSSSGFSVGFGYGAWGNPWGFGGAYEPWRENYANTKQVYTRRVELDIYRGDTYGTPGQERVFEGRALSEGLNGQVEPVLPFILDAIFKDFPGASGSTRTVRVEVPPDTDAAATSTASARSSF